MGMIPHLRERVGMRALGYEAPYAPARQAGRPYAADEGFAYGLIEEFEKLKYVSNTRVFFALRIWSDKTRRHAYCMWY